MDEKLAGQSRFGFGLPEQQMTGAARQDDACFGITVAELGDGRQALAGIVDGDRIPVERNVSVDGTAEHDQSCDLA
jgi:hypothetical protein